MRFYVRGMSVACPGCLPKNYEILHLPRKNGIAISSQVGKIDAHPQKKGIHYWLDASPQMLFAFRVVCRLQALREGVLKGSLWNCLAHPAF